jgi:hypothetical protein
LSALLILIPISWFLFLPDVLAVPKLWFALMTLVALGIAALQLNRQGKVSLGGLCYVAAIDSALTVLLLLQPNGITNSNIHDLDLFVISILIGGLVMRRQFIPILTFAHISLVLLIFFLLPHDPLFVQEVRVHLDGVTYSAVSDTLVLMICGAGIAWLSAWGVDKAILRAGRAEELAEARAHIDAQAREIAKQQERLQQGIAILKEVQAQVANGDYSARASLQDNELFPLAVSLNLMVERLSRLGRSEQQHRRLEKAVQGLIEAHSKIVSGSSTSSLSPTGTSLDQLFPVLERGYHAQQVISQSVQLVDDIFVTQQRQQDHLSKLDASLANVSTLVPTLTKNADEIPALLGDTFKTRAVRVDAKGDLAASEASSPQAQSRQMLEEASQRCQQARQLGTQIMQKLRDLRKMMSREPRVGRAH